ncbi:MAG: hypothetical protein NXI20_03275 [bacterium]|nr:hypothetical protein [bacterium]
MSSQYLPEDSIVAIVDFDNVLGDYFDIENQTSLISAINEIISVCLKVHETDFILIRLYGGWYNNGLLTNRASSILQALGSSNFFPIKKKNGKICRGKVDLAGSLHAIPDMIWPDTYTRRKGLSHIRIDNEALEKHCIQDRPNCPAHILRKFTKTKNKKCPSEGCEAINKDAFVVGEQKMIDTMMSTDIIDLAGIDQVGKLCIFSDDTDLIPPTLYCTTKYPDKIELLLVNELSPRFDLLVSDYNLSYTQYNKVS